MKTVQDYLDLGLVLSDGDKLSSAVEDGWICGKAESHLPLKYHGVVSFAWRNNDGVKPEYKGLVEILTKIDVYNGDTDSSIKNASDVDWRPHCCSHQVAKWRPVVLKSESPTVSTKEDKPMKPVYTAEMHAKGELPRVDSEVKVCIKSAGFDVDEQGLKFEGKTVTVRAAFINAESEKIVAVENEDGNCACYIIECIKPIIKTIKVNGFDVPAPMSEAPENMDVVYLAHAAHADFNFDFIWQVGGTSVSWLSRGLIHSTKSAAIAHAKAMLGIDPNA